MSTHHGRSNAGTGLLVLITATLLTFVLGLPLVAESESTEMSVPCKAYQEQHFDRAIELADEVLGSSDSMESKISASKCKTLSFVATRKMEEAKGSIAEMLELDASARFSPEHRYPPPVIDLYHLVRDDLGSGGMDIRTIAIGDFENNSIYTGETRNLDFSRFDKALVHIITADLTEATPLKIVDRQRTRILLDEIELGQSGFASPEEAVRAGQFLGAQSFVFGQFMLLSKNKVRIDVRVVNTATGEVVLAEEITGNYSGDAEKFMKLEKKLIEALAEGIQEVFAQGGEDIDLKAMAGSYLDGKKSGIKKREEYVQAQFLSAEAWDLEAEGKYSEAMKTWKKALEVDPQNKVARERIQALGDYAMK